MAVYDFFVNEVTLYPNPSNDMVYLKSNETLTDYRVVNILGKVVLAGKLISDESAISIAHIAAGINIIHCKTNTGGVVSKKIVRQ